MKHHFEMLKPSFILLLLVASTTFLTGCGSATGSAVEKSKRYVEKAGLTQELLNQLIQEFEANIKANKPRNGALRLAEQKALKL